MNSFTTTLLVLTVILVLLPSETYAFGAGDIPDFAYLNGKAFRHGDIEDILTELAKSVGHAGGGGGLLGIAQSVLGAATGSSGSKFTKEDVKRVYFGNWLRDYSQAMDIAGLSKLSADTLVLIVSVLGFLTFGFATDEFEVTPDRLGVYLPTEHIDNPKGYAEKEGDARQFHPKLRPPVNPQELEVDQRTGMKNYMASENRGWDTSTALIRRVFRGCIEHGRRARGKEGADLWEAYRLMGTGLHTMEDLLAHSNWCELGLRKLGYKDVFCHVGDNVIIDTPNGRTHPLVTGTFGSADFLHSLMGEATDHLSQASVVDLSKKMNDAQNDNNSFGNLKAILSKLPIGGSDTNDKMGEAGSMEEKAKAYNFDPNNVAPPEVREQLWQLLKWRDGIFRDIIAKIEMIPGLSDLIDGLTNALNAFVYTVLAPYLTPILKQVTDVLSEGSKAVIDSDDQYEVFDDPNASDPSHSLLSKDHFALILNEPAGKIALVVVQHSVKLLVDAWYNDNTDVDRVIDEILEAFHHPYYATGRSRIQQEMFQGLQNWVTGLENVDEVIRALSKDSVRNGKNKRKGSDDDMSNSDEIYGGRAHQSSGGGQYGAQNTGYGSSQASSGGYGAQTTGHSSSHKASGGHTSSAASAGYSTGGGYVASESRTHGQSSDSYGSSNPSYGGGDYSEPTRTTYGETEEPRREHHKKHHESSGYESRRQEAPSYGRQEKPSYGREDVPSYGRQEVPSYGREEAPSYSRQEPAYGRQEPAYGRQEQPTYGGQTESSYGGRNESSYGGRDETSYGARTETSYGGREESYGSRNESSYGGRNESSYGETATYGEEERPRRHHGGGGHGDHQSGREQYGGGYEAPRPPREEYEGSGRREEGYGGGGARPEREGFGSGYAPSYNTGEAGGYGGAPQGGYGGGGNEYGRGQESGYGGSAETYGVEGLSLGEEEPRRHHSGHHGGRHHREEDN
ncbi:heterokaryon incompatibility protein Het-C-domain-containing protein [Lenzites betulinus]|nr:heterokaryon incompatibility protein Het-C-domain-containing protein [Lenzites betulinus]